MKRFVDLVKMLTMVSICGSAAGSAIAGNAPVEATLDNLIKRHVAGIQNRDLAAYESTLTTAETLYLVMSDGTVYDTRDAAIEFLRKWFADTNCNWEDKMVSVSMGSEQATVLMQFQYHDSVNTVLRKHWMTFIFRLESDEGCLVQDQVNKFSEVIT